MQKNYRFVLILIVCIATNISIFAQDVAEYKDVVLDGKPARLNVATGEITLIKSEDKKEVQSTTIVETSEPDSDEASKLESVNHGMATESDFYVVQKGDNLLKLSERFEVSLRDLKKANKLETTLIRPGQRLRVKNFDSVNSSEDIVVSNSNLSNVTSSDAHLVKKGETLYGLSRRYEMSVNELKQKNNLTSNLIKIGQTLNVSKARLSSNNGRVLVWLVTKGDTLYSIARKNGTTVEAIKQLNGLTSNLISIGQKLQLK